MFAARRKGFHRFCNFFSSSLTPTGPFVMCRVPLSAPRDHTTVVLPLLTASASLGTCRQLLRHVYYVTSPTQRCHGYTHGWYMMRSMLPCCAGAHLESRILNVACEQNVAKGYQRHNRFCRSTEEGRRSSSNCDCRQVARRISTYCLWYPTSMLL